MWHQSVGDKIAVNLASLKLPISDSAALDILESMGFLRCDMSVTAIARGLVGKSQYRRGANPYLAPEIVDCSSMTKWIFGEIGIWMPRHSIDQRDMGRRVTKPREGDLVFTSGWRNYYWDDQNDGVGHVGIVTKDSTVIHAANSKVGVVETKLKMFCHDPKNLRGITRILATTDRFLTLRMTKRIAETSQELRWIILQHI
ncbi:MAG: C40 family peptidase [Candidatus Doudnabacteria bacterium]|nr:C40 family peptidase [Candidatus Doudnabacteria bacterium]